jgi:Tfp pilus assembly protein PilZ
MYQDQRRDPRIATRQKLWCEGQQIPLVAETRDVSRNGMFIVTDNAPEVGAQFNVRLDNEEGEVSLQMEVIWRGPKTADNKTGVGVRIVGFDKGREAYERFIHRHMTPSDAPKAAMSTAASAPPPAR